MSVRIIAELPVKPESVSDMKSLMKEILPDTRAFEGCNKIDVYITATAKMKASLFWLKIGIHPNITRDIMHGV